MSHRTDVTLHLFAGLLILVGAGMLIGGIASTIPFAAIASGFALIAVLAQKRRQEHASHYAPRTHGDDSTT
jgi:hypothetical protein